MKLKGAEIVVECLIEQGVDTVFGYPGGNALNIYDALYLYQDKIKHVLTAHEQGASHAADGYARASGKVGVCIATSGPGATNLVTGIATAYMDSIPLVAITCNVPVPLLGRDTFQEIDITGVTMPITKHNYIVKDINSLADTIRDAFRVANSGRKGPVLVDIPKDITAMDCEYTHLTPMPIEPSVEPYRDRIKLCAERIAKAKRPLFYIGGGIISSGASQELIKLAEKADIPVASSMMGLGGFPDDNPLNLGLIGMHGTYCANQATAKCDLLIVAGARFSDRVAGDREGFAKDAEIIQLDIDRAEFDKNVLTDLRIAGDLKQTLSLIEELVEKTDRHEWVDSIKALDKPVYPTTDDDYPDPIDIINEIQKYCDDDTIIVTDVGQHQLWAAQHCKFQKPRTLLTSGGLGTMGFGLGAAIGAKFAKPDSRVVLFIGDGGFHMNLNELTTVASYDVPVTVVVMNNAVLGMVRQWQKVFYGNRFSATDPHRKTDFVKLANAFGVDGDRIASKDDIAPVIKKAMESKHASVIDCRISPDVNVLPMIPPGKGANDIIMEM